MVTSIPCMRGRVTRLISVFLPFFKGRWSFGMQFSPFQCRSGCVRVRAWCRVYSSSRLQGYFPYIVQFRLMFCLHRKPHQLASRASRSMRIYKVCVFRAHRSSVTRPILRIFVHPPAKVRGTIKSVVWSFVRSTSSVKVIDFLHRPSIGIIRRNLIHILFTRHYCRSPSR